MKLILLIGLGRFGKNIAKKLCELNHEVMAIDKQEDRVEDVLSYVTNAQIGEISATVMPQPRPPTRVAIARMALTQEPVTS